MSNIEGDLGEHILDRPNRYAEECEYNLEVAQLREAIELNGELPSIESYVEWQHNGFQGIPPHRKPAGKKLQPKKTAPPKKLQPKKTVTVMLHGQSRTFPTDQVCPSWCPLNEWVEMLDRAQKAHGQFWYNYQTMLHGLRIKHGQV